MKKKAPFLSRFRIVCRPGKNITKLALLGVIVLSTAALVTIHSAISAKEAENNRLQGEITRQEQEIRYWTNLNQLSDTDRGVLEAARDELDMNDPDTILYYFN